MNVLRDIINQTNSNPTEQTYSGIVSSVGNGGNNISIMTTTESRGINNGSPYGFVSSPPYGLYGYVIAGQGDSDDVLVGILDKNRPTNLVGSGGSAMYSIGRATVICNADGSIDINTPTGKTARYNGIEIGQAGQGVTENRVKELIKTDAVTTALDGTYNLDTLLTSRGLTTALIGSQIDDKLDDFETYIIGVGDGRYANLQQYSLKMALLSGVIGDINYIVSGQRVTDEYDEGALQEFVTKTSISEAEINQILYGSDAEIPNVYKGAYVPTLENLPASQWSSSEYPSHDNALFIVTGTGAMAGYYYIFDYDTTSLTWGWRQARSDELNGAITGLDKILRTELTTKYWNAERTTSEITQATGVVDLKVETLRNQTETQYVTITDQIGGIDTELVYHTEAISSNSSRVTLLENQITLKANQTDLTQALTRLGDVETTSATHTAQIALVPQQITSTVTSEIEHVKVGTRNLIVNSITIDYNQYSFDGTLTTSTMGQMTLGSDSFGV